MDRTHRMRTFAPHRPTACRAALTAALAVTAPLLLTLWAAAPARAHGAPTDPVSRVSACSPEGGERARSAACEAAVAANGAPFTAWDNLRVAGVNGRDRQLIPDGKLCSGGLPAYRGLDLARADWPSTRLSPGAKLDLRYRSTIPHTGTFKLYLTKPGYDPGKPLTWSDLSAQPFAEVTDPPLTDGSYRFSATLPDDRSGHHVLYTIWQNTSTVDTYYSCSDVVFPQARSGDPAEGSKDSESATGAAEAGGAEAGGAEAGGAADGREEAAGSAEGAAAPGSPVSSTTRGSHPSMSLIAGGGATALVLAAGAAVVSRRRRGR